MRTEVHGQRRIHPADFPEYSIEDLRRSAEAAVRLRNVHPHEAECVKRLAHRVGEPSFVIVLCGIDVIGREGAERVEDHRQALLLFRGELWKWKDEILADLSQKETLDDRRILVRRSEMGGVGARHLRRSHVEAY